jgi:hypothetical protein
LTWGQQFHHMVMLAAVYADSPARAKLQYAVASWTAYFCCTFCYLMGTMCDGTVRYLGYAKPAPVTTGSHAGKSFQLGVRDSSRVVTSKEQLARTHTAHVRYVAGED